MAADPYDPLKEANVFRAGIASAYASIAARTSPPPSTPRLLELPNGSVLTREGVEVRGPRPQQEQTK